MRRVKQIEAKRGEFIIACPTVEFPELEKRLTEALKSAKIKGELVYCVIPVKDKLGKLVQHQIFLLKEL